MNRYNLVSLLVLGLASGCSYEYGLGSQVDDNIDTADFTTTWNPGGEPASANDTVEIEEETTEDVPAETEEVDDCILSPAYSVRDIYGNTVETNSFPRVEVYTTLDYTDGLHQGESFMLWVKVNQIDPCNDTFTLREISIQLSDSSPGAVWLNDLWADNKGQSNLAEWTYDADGNLTDDQPFPPAFMNTYGFGLDTNHQPVSGGTSYVWAAPESAMCAQTGNYVVDIPTQQVGSAGKLYEFSWPFGSAHVPSGETITFDVMFGWNDDATGYQMESQSWGQLSATKI
ncbi:MAG: hypothetical protein WC802_05290 [Patescibacteria group bacterium]|jgi:hypothetical protein